MLADAFPNRDDLCVIGDGAQQNRFFEIHVLKLFLVSNNWK